MRVLRHLLVPFLALTTFAIGQAPSSTKTKPAPVSKAAPAPTASAAASQDLLDINTATPEQLKAFPGIGDAYAKRIIDGRPYSAKNQLTTRGILPPSTYDKIKDKIVAHRATANATKPGKASK